ncbi:hypothetical protein B296_00042353 [Ensete ventricosum]|uniref:Uncharacterized protein n=1 Tax=Ensete ventricosum TaxID=4639 RepID=A0A426XYZ0_ENSVE|nr:hypothetical protein B296_00042353 [Ensete ventricosum]
MRFLPSDPKPINSSGTLSHRNKTKQHKATTKRGTPLPPPTQTNCWGPRLRSHEASLKLRASGPFDYAQAYGGGFVVPEE